MNGSFRIMTVSKSTRLPANGIGSPGTVSYTHLDVYKRQVWKYPKSAECETRLHKKDSTIIYKSVRGYRMCNEMWCDVVLESVQRLGLLQLSGCCLLYTSCHSLRPLFYGDCGRLPSEWDFQPLCDRCVKACPGGSGQTETQPKENRSLQITKPQRKASAVLLTKKGECNDCLLYTSRCV